MNDLIVARRAARALAAFFLVALVPLAHAQRLPPELAAARQNLQNRLEEKVRAGGERCVKANSVESVELLLEVMEREGRLTRNHFTAGHYRDILMDYLVQIKDIYAQRRVAEESRKNKKHPFARQWAAEALGHYGTADHGASLKKSLSDKFPGVRRWAAWSIGQIGWDGANDKLARLASTKDDYVRANAIEALVRIDAEHYGPGLVVAVRGDKSAAVRCALLGVVPELMPTQVETLSMGALSDEDWRPRSRAVQNLSEVRSKVAVDGLITALKDGRSSIARKALDGLQALTGEPIAQADVWPKWLAANRESFVFPEEDAEQEKVERSNETVTFAGIPVDSDHVAFSLDKSYLMQKAVEEGGGVKSRDQAALDELAGVFERLNGEISFNVYLYDAEVAVLSKKPVALTEKSQKRAMKFASGEASGRSKDMWQVLERVCEVPEIDTVYLISSGEADVGLYCHGNRIGRHLRDLNRYYAKTFHAIAYTEREGDRWHVEQVSKATGGTFKAVQ